MTIELPRLDDSVLAPHRTALAKLGVARPVRTVFAAAHVVMSESYRDIDHTLQQPGAAEVIAEHIDWAATMALRTRLDDLGFGIAEAMDTAQRFFLGWQSAERLIRECGKRNLTHGFIAGAGVDQSPGARSKAEIVDAVVEQVGVIQSAGGYAILLPLVWLAQNDCGEQDYVDVYAAIIDQCDGPLCVHWLGEMFMPALRGYFPGDSFARVMAHDAAKVRGCKLSLLDAELERRVRRELATRDQVVFTGDDFHFASLIAGDDGSHVEHYTDFGGHQLAHGGFSHALLGVFDGIAEPASVALQFLAHGDRARFFEILQPCEQLGQLLFAAPTQHYKAGLAFLGWLNGLQENFMLVNREERARNTEHYLRVASLASRAGAIGNAAVATDRLRQLIGA